MFDTVTFWLRHPRADRALTALTDVQERTRCDSGEVSYTGKCRNLRAKIVSNGISLNGSLAKYKFGHNLEGLSISKTAEVVEELSDRLCLPVQNAEVYRIDLGQTFVMSQPVPVYLNQLGDAKRYKTTEYSNRQTLNYINGKRKLCFYDKAAEMRRHRNSIPESFRHRCLLKYELRFTSRLAQQLLRPCISASLLYEERFYSAIVDRWQQEYFSIPKKKLPLSELNVEGVKQLEKSLALLGIQALRGEDNVMDVIKAAKLQGKLSKSQYQRQRHKMRQLAYCSNATYLSSDTVQELDEKVREAAANCR